MRKKTDFDYFDMFVKISDICLAEANMLLEILKDFDSASLKNKLEKIHEFEHSADVEKHIMMNALLKSFITPIEREDIVELTNALDNVADSIEDILLHIYMFNVSSIREEALRFGEIIVKCCKEIQSALTVFRNFRKQTTINDNLVEINKQEEVADALYTESVRGLYTEEAPAISPTIWKDIFFSFEQCCDFCEDVSETIEGIIMKNL